MTAAVWHPAAHEAYPVLGVEGYSNRCADVVVELPATGPNLMSIPVEDIRVSPDRSIVRSLTADFVDHSAPDRCGCAVRDQGTPRPAVVAQAGAG